MKQDENIANQFTMNSYLIHIINELHSFTREDTYFDDYAFRLVSEEFIGLYSDYKNQNKCEYVGKNKVE